MLKGVIFDLDGILTDTAEFHFQAWQELANEIDIKINRNFNEKLKGVSRMDSLNIILGENNKKHLYNDDEKRELTIKKNNIYKELIKQVEPADLLPGIERLLKEIKKDNIKMAIASASKNAPYILNKLQIECYFDVIVDPKKIKNGKPNPEIFITAAKKLQLKIDEVVGIEDSAAGIESINRAGIYSIAVGDIEILSDANIVKTSTQEITLRLIKEEFRKHIS